MGGAFVAVASDSTATWWNPAGLGAGPFLDLSVARAVTDQRDALPAWRGRTSWLALATPPLGLSYYRFRITDIRPIDPTDGAAESREDERAGVPVGSLSASQFGITVLRTLVTDVHVGTTLKYVRATRLATTSDGTAAIGDLLDAGEALEGGEATGRFDMDIGVLALAGALRLGAVVRNVREPEFDGVRTPRQYRIGAAIDAERVGGIPLTVAVDADAKRYATATGDRRVLAVGGEQWLLGKRLGVRAGGRMNTVGARERSVTAGISVAPRAGTYIEGHIVRGGSADEQGWGAGMRVSF